MTEAVELTQKLVRIESTNPGKGEGSIAVFMSDYLSGCGAKLEFDEVEDGRCNVIAQIDAREQERVSENKEMQNALVLSCHMDTVVLDEGWTYNPLGGEIRDGRLYGRGSCDMKSGLACALSVFRQTAEKVAAGEVSLVRPLKLLCTVDEEGNMQGIERAIEAGDVKAQDWVLDLEPTDGQIQMAHKGRFWIEMTIHGMTAHASKPEQGADAVAAAGEIISRIRRAFLEMPEHRTLGRSTVTFGQIIGGYQPYVVPDKCSVWLDMRLAPPINDKKVLEIIDNIIEETQKEIPGIRTKYKITGNRPYIEQNENSELMKNLKKACMEATGKEPETGAFSGYTDTAVIAGVLHNSECMSYGPGSLKMAHKPDEYVEIADIERCECVLKELVKMIT